MTVPASGRAAGARCVSGICASRSAAGSTGRSWETKITSQSCVLDIGAGPGTLAIPFVGKAAHVTAVEPTDGMVSVLKEKMTEFDVENGSLVQPGSSTRVKMWWMNAGD